MSSRKSFTGASARTQSAGRTIADFQGPLITHAPLLRRIGTQASGEAWWIAMAISGPSRHHYSQQIKNAEVSKQSCHAKHQRSLSKSSHGHFVFTPPFVSLRPVLIQTDLFPLQMPLRFAPGPLSEVGARLLGSSHLGTVSYLRRPPRSTRTSLGPCVRTRMDDRSRTRIVSLAIAYQKCCW